MGGRDGTGVEGQLPERHRCCRADEPRDESPFQDPPGVVQFVDAGPVVPMVEYVIAEQERAERSDEVGAQEQERLELGLESLGGPQAYQICNDADEDDCGGMTDWDPQGLDGDGSAVDVEEVLRERREKHGQQSYRRKRTGEPV